MRFTELADRYLSSVDYSTLSVNSRSNYKSKIGTLKRINGLYAQIMTLPVCNNTKNVYISVNRTVWAWGIDNGLITEAPEAPRKHLKVTNKDRGRYTKDEIERIWEAARGLEDRIYANFLRMCFYTGCRPSELYNLTWYCVGTDYINLMSTKRHEVGQIGRKCAITPAIQECITEAIAIHKELSGSFTGSFTGSDNVFRSLNSPHLNPYYTRTYVKKLHDKVGMAHKQLRHARSGLATAMLEAGYSVYDIQGQLGHSSVGTTERYLRPSMEFRANRYKGI